MRRHRKLIRVHQKYALFGNEENAHTRICKQRKDLNVSGTATLTESKTQYTASVGQETDLTSPVTVTGDGYTVTFAGNNFATKHLRRIRRNSVTSLTTPTLSPAKLTEYITEAKEKSVERWDGKATSTNSLIYLDLGQFCQFGCEVIKFLKGDAAIAWTPYPPPPQAANSMQKHVTVTINKCLAYSHSGTGLVRGGAGGVQGGVGITLNVTVRQVGGSATTVEVCHYAQGAVKGQFKGEYLNKKDLPKMQGIAQSIVT